MLEVVWFVLWVLLWAIYLMLDGYDFGASVLTPFVAKTAKEKQDAYMAVGPFGDGNEVWLIAAGGITFAAFPKAYAVLFSVMYAPLLILLFILIFRAAAIEFQQHMTSEKWKAVWEKIYWVANILAPLVLGVFFANLFTGIAIDNEGVYRGTLLTFFTPYTLVGGILFLALFCMHGGIWLALKTNADVKIKSAKVVRKLWPVVCILMLLFVWMSYFNTTIYDQYFKTPILTILSALLIIGMAGAGLCLKKRRGCIRLANMLV